MEPTVSHPTDRPNFCSVSIGDREWWFSYRTCVAYRGPETNFATVVRENDWGPTTGRHLNYIDGGTQVAEGRGRRRLAADRFRAILATVGQPIAAPDDEEPTDVYLSMDDIPATWEVQPIAEGGEAPANLTEPDDVNGGTKTTTDYVTCGACGLTWDDSVPTGLTPAPSARCPFETFHIGEDD